MEILDELQLFSQKLLQSQELVALCVWLSQKVASTSLMKLCSRLEAYTGILMSPEGLNKRFNRQAVQFLQRLFSHLLIQRLYAADTLPHGYATLFHRIRILDSTTFQLPDIFASSYKGSGGSSHTDGVKIQLEYDLLSGQFLHVEAGPGKWRIYEHI